MDIIQMRRGMGASGSAPLPYDAEIDYLEANGTQYIDTQIVPTHHECGGTFRYMDATLGYICGSYNPNNNRYYGPLIRLGNIVLLDRNNAIVMSENFDTIWHTFKIYADGNKFRYDNTTGTYTSYPPNVALTLTLWGIKANATAPIQDVSHARISSFYIKDNLTEELVRDFIPVRVGQVGYMYDKVSGQLFGNAGTGSFILGPDIQ